MENAVEDLNSPMPGYVDFTLNHGLRVVSRSKGIDIAEIRSCIEASFEDLEFRISEF